MKLQRIADYLERAIAWLSPGWALRRKQARARLAAIGGPQQQARRDDPRLHSVDDRESERPWL